MMLTTMECKSLFEFFVETATIHWQSPDSNTIHWMVDETPNITIFDEPQRRGPFSVAYYE